jgi:predicted 3-demethylubiquinone-9 3-methyltransferase (glyoxalase superfamily)
MQKIIPCLWYDGNAEEAVKFYLSVFKSSKITRIGRWSEAGGAKAGSVLTIYFKLNGQEYLALNGGPEYKFTPGISFSVDCKTQKEVDYYWEKLSKGGKEVACGWLEDKFGMSWQIVPAVLPKMIADKDAKKADRVMRAMMKMVKLDIKTLTDAYKGR